MTVLTRYSYSMLRRLWHFVVRPSVVRSSVTDVLWLTVRAYGKLFTLIISPASINHRHAKFEQPGAWETTT